MLNFGKFLQYRILISKVPKASKFFNFHPSKHSINHAKSLQYRQGPVKEIAGVEHGPGDLVRVGVHMDPVVLDLQVVACFVLHFKLDFEIAPVRLWLWWLILAQAYPASTLTNFPPYLPLSALMSRRSSTGH